MITYDDSPAKPDDQDAIVLRGALDAILYSSDASGYVVGKFTVDDELLPVVATGEMAAPSLGETYELTGRWIQHPRYGRQFRWTSYDVSYPATADGIVNYLASGLVKGVGKSTARNIVDAFGTDTIAVLNNAIERLTEIDGIGEKRLARIRASWEEQRAVQNVMLFLKAHDVGTAHAVRIYRRYGAGAVAAVTENPYRLVDDIEGIGFRTADRIARKLGVEANDPRRLVTGLVHVLKEAARSAGHTYLPREECVAAAAQILEAAEEDVLPALRAAAGEARIVCDADRVALPDLRDAERSIAASLHRLCASAPPAHDQLLVGDRLRAVETRLGSAFAPVQAEAIQKGVAGPVLIVTGGPGTGKTTSVAGMLALAGELGLRTALCAPTGRAAKRLAEVTGQDATTIHRLLDFSPQDGFFRRDEDHPLDTDLLIVDEMSMVDVLLMAALLRALPDTARLVLVGDVDQLPSVGPGAVLRDCIDSGVIDTVQLHYVYRQSDQSSIVSNAHRVRSGFPPVFENRRETFFIERQSADAIVKTIRDVVCQRLPRELFFDPLRDIQVLTPMHQAPAGVRELNDALQRALNPDGRIVFRRGDRVFRLGDKVMQTRNNYALDVFNGDIGVVESADDEESLVGIRFDDRLVQCSAEDCDDIVLAYAITIHKSQGSEYNVVVMPATLQHAIMLQRNLLYTAMTRARRMVIIVGQTAAVERAVHNDRIALRYTALGDLLNAVFF